MSIFKYCKKCLTITPHKWVATLKGRPNKNGTKKQSRRCKICNHKN